jgi:hypothetical protein
VNLFGLEIYKELDLEDHCEFVMGRSMLFLVCIYDNKHAASFARRRWIINIRIKLLLPCVQDKDQSAWKIVSMALAAVGFVCAGAARFLSVQRRCRHAVRAL